VHDQRQRDLHRRVLYFAETAGAFWFLDIIGTELYALRHKQPFQDIHLVVSDSKAVIKVNDGNGNVFFTRPHHVHRLPRRRLGVLLHQRRDPAAERVLMRITRVQLIRSREDSRQVRVRVSDDMTNTPRSHSPTN